MTDVQARTSARPGRGANGAHSDAPAGPANLDAERHLLGEILAAPSRYTEVAELVSGADFYRPAHGHIFDAMGALAAQGLGIDATLVAEQLRAVGQYDAVGGAGTLVEISTAGTGAWKAHARLIADLARRRRIVHAGRELIEAATVGTDLDPILTRVDQLRLPAVTVDPIDPDLDEFLAVDEAEDFAWLVPGLLERGDRLILTAGEGIGKSTLLRQIAVQLASGITPFTLEPIEPLQVLLIDVENSERQARRALRRLRAAAGDRYTPGRLRLRVLGEAIDLARTDVLADLAARVRAQHVDVIITGPLYKLITGDPVKEEPARAVADALDRLRAIRGSALIVEAHSPYAETSKSKRPIRPYGASLWSRWPEFGVYLSEEGKLQHWRAQREGRAWPVVLERSQPWPWAPATLPDEPAEAAYEGKTECGEAIVELLEDGGQYSQNKLIEALRDRGLSYRDSVVIAAAKAAVDDGRITRQRGTNRAWLYSLSPIGQEALDAF